MKSEQPNIKEMLKRLAQNAYKNNRDTPTNPSKSPRANGDQTEDSPAKKPREREDRKPSVQATGGSRRSQNRPETNPRKRTMNRTTPKPQKIPSEQNKKTETTHTTEQEPRRNTNARSKKKNITEYFTPDNKPSRTENPSIAEGNLLIKDKRETREGREGDIISSKPKQGPVIRLCVGPVEDRHHSGTKSFDNDLTVKTDLDKER